MMRLQSASSISSVATRCVTPAAQTRMSTRPRFLPARLAQALERREVADVGGDAQRAAPALLDSPATSSTSAAPARRDDVGARIGKTKRERAADAARAADDDGHPAGEIKQ